ncbi:hypothetical protein [Nannocystis sp. SCPEA4]|uniref:hypothetical protein n=1 Tax=Nannocystis sp. SCPEA4 TaxID=2996787 RepID=UPI00226EFE5F|nr:hypothetical protein [Nannocystis sp. SCPEA4]MCY1059364.1 hypothetical protein [Nannocystis sp. SCPEA4]
MQKLHAGALFTAILMIAGCGGGSPTPAVASATPAPALVPAPAPAPMPAPPVAAPPPVGHDFVATKLGDWQVELHVPPGSTIEPDPDESVTMRIFTPATCGENIMVDRMRPGEMEGSYRGAKRNPGKLTKNYVLQLDRRTADGFEVKVSYDKPDGETVGVVEFGRKIGDYEYFCGGTTNYGDSRGMPSRAVDCVYATCASLRAL